MYQEKEMCNAQISFQIVNLVFYNPIKNWNSREIMSIGSKSPVKSVYHTKCLLF